MVENKIEKIINKINYIFNMGAEGKDKEMLVFDKKYLENQFNELKDLL